MREGRGGLGWPSKIKSGKVACFIAPIKAEGYTFIGMIDERVSIIMG
jgi:hypothetical protein